MAEKRLIDANAFVEKLQSDFKKVFTNAGQKVKPEDYYITRKSVYDADLFKAEVDSFCDMVNCQPTVDAVEVVHGFNTYDHNSAFECSICGFSDWDTMTADDGKYNYCPHCGAKMDGERRTDG